MLRPNGGPLVCKDANKTNTKKNAIKQKKFDLRSDFHWRHVAPETKTHLPLVDWGISDRTSKTV